MNASDTILVKLILVAEKSRETVGGVQEAAVSEYLVMGEMY